MANKPLKSIKFPGLSDTYTVPEVDSTLTGSGKAADAKAVGDQLGDLKSALINDVNGKMDFSYLGTFVNGGLLNGVLQPDNKKRVSSDTIISTDRELLITAADGFRCAVHYFVDNVFTLDTGLNAGKTYISKGTSFKISIARVTEVSGEIANVDDFVQKVTFTSIERNLIDEATEESQKANGVIFNSAYDSKITAWELGQYNTTTGQTIAKSTQNSRCICDLIPCKQYDKYSISVPSGYKLQVINVDNNNVIVSATGFQTGTYSDTFTGTKYAIMVGNTGDGNVSIKDMFDKVTVSIVSQSFPYGDNNSLSNIWGNNYLAIDDNIGFYRNGISIKSNADGSITINGTATSGVDYYLLGANDKAVLPFPMISGKEYILSSGNATNANVIFRLISTNGSTNNYAIGKDHLVKIGDDIKLIIRITNGATISNLTLYPMIRSIGFNSNFQNGFDRSKISKDISNLKFGWISPEHTSKIKDETALYNGIKINSGFTEIARLAVTGYTEHDGTIILYDNKLYCVYCKYSGTGGDSANNPNATVQLTVVDMSGNIIIDKTVAKNGDTHGTLSENGGAGSPNAYLVEGVIHILYTAYVNSTYQQMHCEYDITNDSLGNYAVVTVDGSALNNAWVRNHFGYTTSQYSDTAYTSAQANCTIATDGTNYYIGWVCGSNNLGRAIIFKTQNFYEWEIFWEYAEHIYPRYEMALAYKTDSLYYAIRPNDSGKGIAGKIRVADGFQTQKCYYPNCASRPAFFVVSNNIYLFTNPSARNLMQLYKINETDITQSELVADCYGGYTYPSFSVDGTTVYMLRTDNGMQLVEFTFTLSSINDVQSIMKQVFGI